MHWSQPRGMPFALLYLTQSGGKTAALVAHAGIDDLGWPGAPPLIDLEATGIDLAAAAGSRNL